MLKKTVIRDGRNRLVGSTTSGYAAGSTSVRDAEGRLLGRTSEKFHSTRDSEGRIVSINTPDAGLLFGDDNEWFLAGKCREATDSQTTHSFPPRRSTFRYQEGEHEDTIGDHRCACCECERGRI